MLARYWDILVRVGEVMLSNKLSLTFLWLNPRKVISCLCCMPSMVPLAGMGVLLQTTLSFQADYHHVAKPSGIHNFLSHYCRKCGAEGS